MTRDSDQMSIYAPIRLRGGPYWKYAVEAAKQGAVTPSGMIATHLPQMISTNLLEPSIRMFVDSCDNKEDAGSLLPCYYSKIANLRHWIPIIGQYELCGRQIFDIEPRLVEMFSNTDVGDASLEDIHLPYECFYIRFGRQDHIKLPYQDDGYEDGFEYLEGAFIARTPFDENSFRLRLGFITVLKDGSGLTAPGYYIDLMPHEQKMGIMDAVESAIARNENGLKESEENEALYLARLEHLQESAALLKDGASLLVNALFYIENIKDNLPIKTEGRDTPPSLILGKSVKKHKAESKLYAHGYSMVRLIGSEYENNTVIGQTGSKAVHWRRGHWRNQHYGEANRLIKRIWLKPVIVGNTSEPGIDPKGHIYKT